MLAGDMDLPAAPPRGYALFAHCFTCSKDLKAATYISRSLASRGIAVLRFDFTGIGQSEGNFAHTTFSSNVEDLVAAARHLAALGQSPQLLIGHSLGGAAVLLAAAQVASCIGVVTIGAPGHPGDLARHFQFKREQIEMTGSAEVVLGGRSFRISKRFLDDLRASRMEEAIQQLNRALLLFHSPADAVVDISNAERIFAIARHPKSFVALDGADHLLSRMADSRYLASITAAWAEHYIGTE
jgi:alpha-beta hydrolase superfamily lysophospholipase